MLFEDTPSLAAAAERWIFQRRHHKTSTFKFNVLFHFTYISLTILYRRVPYEHTTYKLAHLQNLFCTYMLSLHKETNIIQKKMTKTVDFFYYFHL